MEFNEKLQVLRKAKGLTQEELADALFVSRTAISKWESGRGYPTIDSIKAIAKFFSVTIDELLSTEEALTMADNEGKERESRICDTVFGLLDIGAILLLFLPIFADRDGEFLKEASLLDLGGISSYFKFAFIALIALCFIFGATTLALQGCKNAFWLRIKRITSLSLNLLCALLFVLCLQPYGAIYLFLFLIIKVFLLIKRR